MTNLPALKVTGHRSLNAAINGGQALSVILASPFSFELLQFPVIAQPFPNRGHCNDQQNDDGEADSEGEAVGKQDHS
jgi:hypothetical protein